MKMNEKYFFSIMDFCQNFIDCRRKRSRTKRFEELSVKNIIENCLRRNSFSNAKLCKDKKRLSKSSPNLCAQVNGNFTLKPTISIKRDYWDPGYRNELGFQNSLHQTEKLINLTISDDYRNILNKRETSNQQNFKTDSKIKRHRSLNKRNLVKNFITQNRLFNSQNFTSCPDINHLVILPREKMDSCEQLDMIDNVDDFTTNLFLKDELDESQIDLVSINIDIL